MTHKKTESVAFLSRTVHKPDYKSSLGFASSMFQFTACWLNRSEAKTVPMNVGSAGHPVESQQLYSPKYGFDFLVHLPYSIH